MSPNQISPHACLTKWRCTEAVAASVLATPDMISIENLSQQRARTLSTKVQPPRSMRVIPFFMMPAFVRTPHPDAGSASCMPPVDHVARQLVRSYVYKSRVVRQQQHPFYASSPITCLKHSEPENCVTCVRYRKVSTPNTMNDESVLKSDSNQSETTEQQTTRIQ